MSDAVVSRSGQINQANAVDALFLKVFAGEVMAAYEGNNILLDKHNVRTITSGKSAQFPFIGKIGSEYHTAGAEILGTKVDHAEQVIAIDGLLLSHAFIADIDEAMNHYEVRSQYSMEMGRQFAKAHDIAVFRELTLSARASAVTTDGNGGTEIINDKYKIDGVGTVGSLDLAEQALALAAGLFAGAQAMDEKDIPEDNRFCAFRPEHYYALVQNKDAINRDWGGQGAYSEGNIFRVAGVNILKSNNVPSTDTSSTDLKHGVDASGTIGTIWHPQAVGTVKLLDLSLQSEWDIRRQGTLMVARYAMGHGGLRPDSAVELKLDTLTN